MHQEHLSSPSAHLHAHHSGDAKHVHVAEARKPTALAVALVLTLGFAAIEVVFGFLWDPLESTCRHASLSIL